MSRILPTIVLAQFGCTSLWFAGNAVAPELAARFGLPPGFVAVLTSAVQLGFIGGTLTFALLAVADRFSPSRVFFVSALLAAGCNLALNAPGLGADGLLACRFLTGFFLAGIYPVGMKIAADYYAAGLGRSLGFLVGALVLGTAFPHLLRGLSAALPWQTVTTATSALAALGGLAMLALVPDGPPPPPRPAPAPRRPARRFPRARVSGGGAGLLRAHVGAIHVLGLRANDADGVAGGAPGGRRCQRTAAGLQYSGGGGGGVRGRGAAWPSRRGARAVAAGALVLSGACCLLSPLVLGGAGPWWLGPAFLGFWGLVVVADSPLLSTLVAQQAPPASRGTALTLVTCLGFALTIASLQFTSWLATHVPAPYVYLPLALGPLLGLWGLLGRGRVIVGVKVASE
ncbi:MFS transporter [Hymenobacter amundsenii]|uniref:MFS transporter n=1 Tax=Hymenobacter amundsenii TaxID=2006685 RepID=UPI0021CDDD13|nr:MFS transporter [Hymenobacter amundsenii]